MRDAVLDEVRASWTDVVRLRRVANEARLQHEAALAAFDQAHDRLTLHLAQCRKESTAVAGRLREEALAVYREYGIPRPLTDVRVTGLRTQ